MKYPRLPRLIYVQKDETVKQLGREAIQVYKYVQRMKTVKQSGIWSGLGKRSPHR